MFWRNLISGNIVLVFLIFSGIYTYDRSIQFADYSPLVYGALLLSRQIGMLCANLFFNKVWNSIGVFKYFILSVVMYCQFGILFVFDANYLWLRLISYAVIGFSVNSISLIVMGLLRSINANQFFVSITSLSSVFALLLTAFSSENMLVVLFMSISSLIPYLFMSNASELTPTVGINNQLSYKSFVICYRYYGKFFWNLLLFYVCDYLFGTYLVSKILSYHIDVKDVKLYVAGVTGVRFLLNYPFRYMMSGINPVRKMIIVSTMVIISCICELLSNNMIGSYLFIVHAITGLFSSLYLFPMEYFERYRLQRHKAIPTIMVSNVISSIAYLIAIPIGVMSISMSQRIGTTYVLMLLHFICILNTVF